MAEVKHMAREDLYKKQIKLLSEKRTLALIFILCASLARGVCAQFPLLETPDIPITPEPVGSGARALGQSAFIAVADDATAASWNPAGLINLERPEASFVGAWRTVTKDYSVADSGISIDQDSWSGSEINFMSYAHPLQVGNTDVVISLNYHQVYDFGVEFNGVETTDLYLYGFYLGQWLSQVEGKSEGAISAYSLASGLTMPSYPEIAIGASFNWYAQSVLNNYAWQIKAIASSWLIRPPPSASIPLGTIEVTDTFDDFSGHNFTLGLLWDAYEREENLLTLGFVYHTPFTAKVDRELTGTNNGGLFSWPRERMDIDFPSSLGAGVNYRLSDSLSAAFDVEWKEWSKFKQKSADGTVKSPVEDDTLAYRLGAEHLTFLQGASETVLACRGGAFYEPRPVTNYRNTIPIYGISAGLGWTLREQFSLDFAYQYRWGEQDLGNIDYKIKEQFFVASLITYF